MKSDKKQILSGVVLVLLLVAIILRISWATGPFYYHFANRRLVDLYSYFQLFATAYISFLICRNLGKESSLKWRQNPSVRPFFISAVGFLLLGFDDVLSLHENMDKLIHHILRIKETPLTDHLDDIIFLMYGIVAIFFIKDFVREFKKHPYMVKLIICGLFFFFATFCMDFMSNNMETFKYFFKGLPITNMGHTRDIFRMLDESFELLGEAFFLSAFAASLINVKTRQK